jgi:LysM repeat protein
MRGGLQRESRKKPASEEESMKNLRLHFLPLAGLLIFAILVGACTRSASTPPSTEPEEDTTGGQTSQQATMEAVRSALLTQTAQAQEASQPTPTAESTSGPTEAPTSAVTVEGAEVTESGPVEYTVKSGDWLFKIAREFGVDPQAIIDLNNLTDPGSLEPGLVLKIPVEAAETPPEVTGTPTAGGTIHIVQAGEWIWQIARNYGVDPQAIIDANNLLDPGLIYPGMELTIP